MAKTSAFRAIRLAIQQYVQEQRREQIQTSEPSFNRRQFLETSTKIAGLISLGGLNPLLAGCGTKAIAPEAGAHSEEPFVAIIGAGASGLAAAYALKKRNVPFRVFEASGRFGGRIFTRDNFQQNQFIEAGGELIDTNHVTMIKLAEEFGLALDEFPLFDQGVEPEMFVHKNHFYTHQQLAKAVKPLVEKVAEVSKTFLPADGILSYATMKDRTDLIRLDQKSLKQFLDEDCQSTDSWVRKMVEVAYVGELGLDADYISCLTFIQMINQELSADFSMFGSSDESKRIHGGNSRLIEALYNFVGKEQVVQLNHQLLRIEQVNQQIRLVFQADNRTKDVVAGKVILATPLTVLRKVEGLAQMELSPAKKKYLQSLNYGTNSKLMMGYQSRFWRQKHAKIPACTGAFFGDFPSQSFWETSRHQEGVAGIITNFSGGKRGKQLSQEMTKAVVMDFAKLYPGSEQKLTGKQFLMNWSKYKYNEGSYACVGPGQYSSFWGTGKEPELNGRLIFAGEHTSDEFQGFMNGALESGLRAASQI